MKQMRLSQKVETLLRVVYQPVYEQKQFVKFYGMSSRMNKEKHFGGPKIIGSSEGKEVLVPSEEVLNHCLFYIKFIRSIYVEWQ